MADEQKPLKTRTKKTTDNSAIVEEKTLKLTEALMTSPAKTKTAKKQVAEPKTESTDEIAKPAYSGLNEEELIEKILTRLNSKPIIANTLQPVQEKQPELVITSVENPIIPKQKKKMFC